MHYERDINTTFESATTGKLFWNTHKCTASGCFAHIVYKSVKNDKKSEVCRNKFMARDTFRNDPPKKMDDAPSNGKIWQHHIDVVHNISKLQSVLIWGMSKNYWLYAKFTQSSFTQKCFR